MARVLLTGGAGFLGSRTALHLVEHGHEVAIYDRQPTQSVMDRLLARHGSSLRIGDRLERIRVIQGDTLHKDHLRRQVVLFKPSTIIHLSAVAIAARAAAETEEAFNAIVGGTHNITEIMRDCDWGCRLTLVSSSMVYGNFQYDQITEDHPKIPTNFYGSLKLASENIAKGYAEQFGLDVAIVRPSAVYGPNDPNERIVNKWIRLAQENKPLIVDGDGSLRMPFTHVADFAEGLVACALSPQARGLEFNVANHSARSLGELASILRSHFPGLQVEYRDQPKHVPTRGALSIERARTIAGFQPKIALEEGVRDYISHLHSNPY